MAKPLLYLSLLALFFLVVSFASESVLVLTKDNFNEIITNNEFVLVEFYAPWCGHCKRLEPEYESAATALKDEKVVLAKVDATVEGELASQHGIQGYPTLKWFINGEEAAYTGPRDARGIENWILKRIGPPARTIDSEEALTTFNEKPGFKVLAVVEEGSVDAKNFLSASLFPDVDEFEFYIIYDSALVPSVQPQVTKNAFILYSADKAAIASTDLTSNQTIVDFINQNGYPLVNEFGQAVFTRAQKTKKPIVVGFIMPDEHLESNTGIIRQLAVQFSNKAVFVIASSEQDLKYAANWGASGTVYPTMVFVDLRLPSPKPIAFYEDVVLSVESGAEFIEGSLAGTVAGFIKSEPVPESNDGPVKVVVGKSFNDIVYDAEKDVLVEFYAPWCGHCQKLVPIYEQLGAKFKSFPNVVISKIDATANSFPRELNIRGFPTLLFFKSNDKKNPIHYEGERTLDDLTQFIVDNSNFDLSSVLGDSSRDEL
eukprot:TRINITY_DN6028_c0_g2_i1.p1 TRINITY_DN6028_c0_g2~~TRINITY_DN6028_c0_g2_i1.p1  ORF type:complete len:485 (-),score=112.50 TRINITY_DN6028_c0_g2_i1:28-1482(-)